MKQISDEIFQWSVFNEEKGLDFNGLYIRTSLGAILMDPPPLSEEDVAQIEQLGPPKRIYLTNKHHTRAAAQHRDRWGAKIYVPLDDQEMMEIPVDGTYSDGELIANEIEAINLPDSKTPGECAFHWPQKKTLIIGDGVIHKPTGLAMLPDEKFKDPKAARHGLLALRGIDYDILLVGDGAPITENAKASLEAFIDRETAA